jgi:hypothetical protein
MKYRDKRTDEIVDITQIIDLVDPEKLVYYTHGKYNAVACSYFPELDIWNPINLYIKPQISSIRLYTVNSTNPGKRFNPHSYIIRRNKIWNVIRKISGNYVSIKEDKTNMVRNELADKEYMNLDEYFRLGNQAKQKQHELDIIMDKINIVSQSKVGLEVSRAVMNGFIDGFNCGSK